MLYKKNKMSHYNNFRKFQKMNIKINQMLIIKNKIKDFHLVSLCLIYIKFNCNNNNNNINNY